MAHILKLKLNTLLSQRNPRNQKIFRNIIKSFGVKGGGILVSLILVPLTIDYVNPIQYGVWLTISSVVTWMNFFDIGLGNGLRNKLTISLSSDNIEEARKYISTTYASLFLISVMLSVLFWIAVPLVNWNAILNIPKGISEDLSIILLIVLGSFCLQFVVQIINTVLTASHEPAIAAFLSFLGQLAILIAVIILKLTTSGSLYNLVWVLALLPSVIFLLASIYLYSTSLKDLKPSIKKIDFGYASGLMSTGGKFFIIQIGAMILFQSNNIIITKIIGPEAVTEFNVSFKMFSVVSLIFNIILTPYWSAFTEAHVKKDYDWMKKTLISIRKIWLLLSIGAILILLLSKWLIKFWVGSDINYNQSLSIAMTIYIIVFMWQTLHVYFLNGLNIITVQLILVIIGSVINIPLAITLGNNYGLTGVITANTIVFILIGLLCSFQVQSIIYRTAKGIWVK